MGITLGTYGKQQWTMQTAPPPLCPPLRFSFRKRKYFLVIVLVSNYQADNFFYGASAVNILAGRCDIEGQSLHQTLQKMGALTDCLGLI